MEDIETAKQYFVQALAAHKINDFEHAAQLLRQALQLVPDRVSVLVNLSAALLELDNPSEARQYAARSVEIDPQNVDGWLNLGHAQCKLQLNEEAIGSFAQALQISPNSAEAWTYRGNALSELKRHQAALDSLCKAIALRPEYAEAWCNQGNALFGLGRYQEAVESYERAIALKPDFATAYNNHGNALRVLKLNQQALESYDRAVDLKPDFADAWKNRGNALYDLKLKQLARESYDRAIALKPDFAEAYGSRGKLIASTGERRTALDDWSRAIELSPASSVYRLHRLVTQFSVIAQDNNETMASRVVFASEAIELEKWIDSTNPDDGVEAVGNAQLFFLAYQQENNRDLLRAYGDICIKLMRRRQSMVDNRHGRANPAAESSRIRLGIVSAHISSNSVWNAFVKGWFQRLDADIFEIHVFHLGDNHDAETDFAMSRSASFHEGIKTLERWIELIMEKNIQVQIFPEIGMEPLTIKLASLRLAPVQVVAWGHPETTGLPTIDYYLSAADFETPKSQGCYTEKLVPLPNLGCYYDHPEIPAANVHMAQLGLHPWHAVLVCAGTPFKYAPEHDQVFVEIAKRVTAARFLFFTFYGEPQLSQKLFDRLSVKFKNDGLDFSRFSVLAPWQTKPEFYGIMKQADVFLDTIGFSGFNTAMQAVECGLPIVTFEGAFMRGRFATAILRRIGLEELVAHDEQSYIECAVKLAQSKPYRDTIRAIMEKNRHILYNDEASITALKNFLLDATRRVQPR